MNPIPVGTSSVRCSCSCFALPHSRYRKLPMTKRLLAVPALALAAALSLSACSQQQVVSTNPDGSRVVTVNSHDISLQVTPNITAAPSFVSGVTPAGWSTTPPAGDRGGATLNNANQYTLYQQNGQCVITTGLIYLSATNAGSGDLAVTKAAYGTNTLEATSAPVGEQIAATKTDSGGRIEFWSGSYTTNLGAKFVAVRGIDKLFPNGMNAKDIPKTTTNSNVDFTKGLPALTFTVTCPTAAELEQLDPAALLKQFTVTLPTN